MTLLPVDEALSRILAAVPAPTAETVPLVEAAGRVLAAPLTALHNQPPFDSSAMDGYAVRAADVQPGRAMRMIGTAQAGQRFSGLVGAGQCVRIFTGAPMPIGTDAVIMQEEADADGAVVAFEVTPQVGRSVRKTGMDFARGQALLPVGTLMTPQAMSLAAAANQSKVTVAKRLRIALLSTGDELVAPGSSLGPDQIIASNAFGLRALLAPYAAEIIDLGIVRDEPTLIDAALLKAIDLNVDVIITTGGASVGDRDHMEPVLRNLGVDLQFWKIRMRPGKPLMFGTRGKTLVFGLPGNPVSALVTAAVFIRPALRKALGALPGPFDMLRLPLAAATPPNTERRHYMRGTIVVAPNGIAAALPIAETDSSHTSSLAMAQVLIVQPEQDPGRPSGTLVEVIPLNGF